MKQCKQEKAMTFDGGTPECVECKWLERPPEPGRWRCRAFPRGIPDAIKYARVSHTRPYKGDHGIRFESMLPQK